MIAPALTKNQTLVFDVLSHSDGPLSAYTILDKLRDHGFRAPLQVYRALDICSRLPSNGRGAALWGDGIAT